MTVIGAVLALEGCSATGSDSSGGSAEPPVSSTPVMLRTAGVAFPLDAYEAPPSGATRSREPKGVLTSGCMARLDSTYQSSVGPGTSFWPSKHTARAQRAWHRSGIRPSRIPRIAITLREDCPGWRTLGRVEP